MKHHAALVIRDRNGRVLFVKRALTKKVLPGAWSFPSGTQEEGEDILETARREAKEELGIEIIDQKVVADVELSEFGSHLHFILCEKFLGEPKILQEHEMSEMRWMTFEEFFNTFSDDQIGHGLVWLRKHSEIYKALKY